ncbi:MAG: sulfatase-like hydrolase/transferase [Bacteroidetes bacterium]|nr:sulfatase-like hydrolase/transferase [Bacteroidota bacterium]
MKQRLRFFFRYAIFWIVYFILARFFFLIYENSFSLQLSFKETILVFVNGLRMDLSTTGYIMAAVGLILTLTSITNGKWINKIIKPFTIFVLVVSSVIVVVDMELYKNWGFRMDATPLLYITQPKEAMASTALWLEIALVLFIVALVLLGICTYNRKIKPQVLKIEKGRITAPLFLLLLTGSMILPIRGSVGIAPMNTGMVYFSENKFANHAAVNVVWNVMNSVFYRKNHEKSYSFMSDRKAEEIVHELNRRGGNAFDLISSDNPNVVIILLESFSSKVIPELGGRWNAAPNLSNLMNEGIVFKNLYANASRSDKGILSVLSGYPGQPTTSIIKTPTKTESLPSVYKSFSKHGYETYFYYGGDIDFANMRSYFLNAGVDHLITVDNFDKELNNSKWGVHDEYLFNYLYEDLLKDNQPYLKTAFTLSSHDPYEVPMHSAFDGTDLDSKYLNSVAYTDSCLGDFFRKIKATEIWNNTLFILIADHGSARPGNSQNHELEKFEIPMLWLGGVLNDSVQVVNRIGSQIDIPATVLSQLGFNYNDYAFSKNILSEESNEFAFYVFNDGFSFITDSSKVIYDNVGNRILYQEGKTEDDLIKGKAYLQYLMNDFSSR